MRINRTNKSKGFTLVEMMVVAPIVILFIGGFIATIVNLTAEAMASRSANLLTYNVQEALNRIEEDVKLSSAFLAENSISVASTKQGYGGTVSAGSMVNFSNINRTSAGGSPASIILSSIATTQNPLSESARFLYLKDQPNPCTTESEYVKNRPMVYNVVYFVDSSNSLWRRTIMPSDYADASKRCGSQAPWQVPSCIKDYTSALSFCKTTDEKLADGVSPADFKINYYPSANSETASAAAVNTSASVSSRNSALLATPTIGVSITSKQTSAGRDISYTGTLRATRLDTNATAVASIASASAAPAAPAVSAKVTDGHLVTFSWPQVSGAERYDIDYCVRKKEQICSDTVGSNNIPWVVGPKNLSNTTRSYTVSSGWHTDTVEARVRSANSAGTSGYTTYSTVIPLWAPLPLQDGWTDYSGGGVGYTTAGFTRTASGMVIIKGLIKKSPSVAENAYNIAISNLPPDYRPTGRLIFGSMASGNSNARLDVASDGTIIYDYGSQNDWLALDTIRFLASTAPYTRESPTLLNGWVNYGGSWASASYAKDSTGRAFIQGLVKSGTITDNTPIFNPPSAYSPPLTHHFASQSNNIFAHIGANTTPSITAKGTGTNSYLSINQVYIPSAATGYTWKNLTFSSAVWSYYGNSNSTVQYTKSPDGVVHLKGLVRPTPSTTTSPSVIGTLDAGFRPSTRIIHRSVGTAAIVRIDILSNGQIVFNGPSTAGSWISLDGISFLAEQ